MTTIRIAKEKDLKEITKIYNHYIVHSYATFDTTPHKVEERQEWFSQFRCTGPYRLFVVEQNNRVIGWCSSKPYRLHPSFKETIECSVYIQPDSTGNGLGKLLYKHLFENLKNEPIHLAVAGVALPNPSSVALHKALGFQEVGIFHEYAVKNGVYISSAWFEKRFL